MLKSAVSLQSLLVQDAYLRGRSQVELARRDPAKVRELELGRWFESPPHLRAARRVLSRPRFAAAWKLVDDASFWAGVRSEATPNEWHHLTRSRYVALYYHRLAGLHKPGQERLDVSPDRFSAQMRLLKRFGFMPLPPDELIRFHRELGAALPRRSIVITADDGFDDCVEPLLDNAELLPCLFVVTDAVGGTASWVDDEPLADWDSLQRLERAGVAIGSHTRSHAVLDEVDPSRLADELDGAAEELLRRLSSPTALLAYPHGRHDRAVRGAAASAGYGSCVHDLARCEQRGNRPVRPSSRRGQGMGQSGVVPVEGVARASAPTSLGTTAAQSRSTTTPPAPVHVCSERRVTIRDASRGATKIAAAFNRVRAP